MSSKDGIALPIGDPMEQFKARLVKKLRRVRGKLNKMARDNSRGPVSESENIKVRAEYNRLLRLEAEIVKHLATL